MEFQYRYFGHSKASSDPQQTNLSFAPDSLRPPTFFVADLAQHLVFREAISALHAIVVSDQRFKPKDRTDYLAWLEENEQALLAEFLAQKQEVAEQIQPLQRELAELNKKRARLFDPYYRAQRRYFDYLFKTNKEAWFVLDPVITVHPDQVFFECFSQDESSYGRLSCHYNSFKNIRELAYGTTNIDYSESLYQEFQKIRDYRSTRFEIDPTGFAVSTTQADQYIEQKIDLPDSWVRSFLQVNAALTLSLISFDLHPMDVHNICFQLRRYKEQTGPRSLRIRLTPNRPVELIFEPWNTVLTCPRSQYQGTETHEIRIWGRRRLLILERLIPLAKRFTVRLLGTGLPSFWVADLGDLQFTLGLSGWTANDWSQAGNFDLMAPRAEVDSTTAKRVIDALHACWCASSQTLAQALELDETLVKSALAMYAQQGRVLYDTENELYRLRELSQQPLPLEQLRFSNPREAKARNFQIHGLVTLQHVNEQEGFITVQGDVLDNAKQQRSTIYIDADQRLFKAECSCDFYIHNRLHQGPCEHMLALRMQFAQQAPKANRL